MFFGLCPISLSFHSFSLISSILFHRNIFVMATLKSFLDYFNISLIVVVSYCFIFFQFKIFLILDFDEFFSTEVWACLYCIMKLWLFWNLLFYLIFFAITPEEKVACYGQVETEVLFPHLCSTNIQSGHSFLLLLGKGMCFSSLLVSHGGSGLVTAGWWWMPWLP